MSTSAFPFSILEHELPCSHIREYPLATANTQEDVLYLAIKQYIPKDNKHPQPGDVTIIGAHANGFPKVREIFLRCVQKLTTHRNSTSLSGKNYTKD